MIAWFGLDNLGKLSYLLLQYMKFIEICKQALIKFSLWDVFAFFVIYLIWFNWGNELD